MKWLRDPAWQGLAGVAALVSAVAVLVQVSQRDGGNNVQPVVMVPTPAANTPAPVVAAVITATTQPTSTPIAPIVATAMATVPPTPSRTPVPPTPQPVTAPTFIVNSQPVGCHAEPSESAGAVVQHPTGTVLAMDQLIRLPDGTWHREKDRQCWVRTQPGPTEVFSDQTRAQSASVALLPVGSILYQADWRTGPGGWITSPGWGITGGMLVSDGSISDATRWIEAPIRLDQVTDYAVEARIQFVSFGTDFGFVCPGSAGIVVRSGYWVGYFQQYLSFACQSVLLLRVKNDANVRINLDAHISARQYKVDRDFHLYRVEVRGNRLSLFVDGIMLLDGTDNRFLNSGQVGLWSSVAQIAVQSFRVIKL